MKKQARSFQYTIRGIPADVDRILRQKAERRKQSLNQVVLEELSAATVGRTQRADFGDLVGQWTPDPDFDAMVKAQRQIDPEKWR
jgi:hypothetical protein